MLYEAERCNSQLQVKGGGKKADSNHSIRVFTRLILCGKLREAVRWITGRASGGVLDVNAVDAKSGMTVLECLKEKHPEPSQIDEKAFLAYDVLPPLIEIDITASHVEQAAHSLRSGAGPSGVCHAMAKFPS